MIDKPDNRTAASIERQVIDQIKRTRGRLTRAWMKERHRRNIALVSLVSRGAVEIMEVYPDGCRVRVVK